MNTLQQVEFVHAWRNYRVGQRITPNGMLRDWLIRAKLAKLVPVKTRRRRKAS